MRCSFTVKHYISTSDFPAHITPNKGEREDNRGPLMRKGCWGLAFKGLRWHIAIFLHPSFNPAPSRASATQKTPNKTQPTWLVLKKATNHPPTHQDSAGVALRT